MLSGENTVTGVRTNVNHKGWQLEQKKLLPCMSYRWLHDDTEMGPGLAWLLLDFPKRQLI